MLKESGSRSTTGRWHSAPADRNTGPIRDVLERVLPARGKVLEIASGTGQHVVAFARAFPHLVWQPSDLDGELRSSVGLWITEARLPNIEPPIDLDVLRRPWPVPSAQAILCINMIHVAPWAATDALFAGASDILDDDGVLVTYGPYMRDGRHTAPSNAAFDEALRARRPDWGLRDIDAVAGEAMRHGFGLAEVVAMPANNFTLVFKRPAGSAGRAR